jgi:hypothetical protein
MHISSGRHRVDYGQARSRLKKLFSLSRFVCHAFIFSCLSLWIMVSRPLTMENMATSTSQRIVQIRQKIKEVFGWDCTMKDDVLVKRYSMTSEGN